ncbi:NAD(P)/FAD-dependent oxidoreductase [Synechococcus sp. BA-132 BA5]|uniref:NAD(P)/FAD-dependent oxidoreductase n=1 Tax=Synechococcus sp. BA-132 BA5 TaxID=3110252 RepID=UPI002B200273|nr:NAD(P)/FAD-dependent oxidoreductase [Synechococcus sp. BA-132 BA5]MEA5415648.1 NAD(P)/FAD-dependent oxidoreductase [Synechococcus sp. BA-132 BA5]
MSETAHADVIVVGAGAAGSAAAFHLAARGRRVILLEAQAPGRAKPCGGGMAASVQRWFPFDLAPTVDQVIRRVRFTWCLEDPVTAELPGASPFWIVRRSVLDAFLAQQAVQAGCDLRHGCRAERIERRADGLWEVSVPGEGPLRARAVVIADGSSSRFAAPLGLGPPRPRFAATVSVEVAADPDPADMARFEFGLVHHGFCWVFPRQGGYSIGVGTFVGQQEADSEAVLSALLPSLGLPAAAGERRHGQLRVWNGHHALHGPGLVAVGDAASLCDPFLAEGLRPSLLSGCEAAAALDLWLDGDGLALERYSLRMREAWGDSMAWGKRIAQVFYRVPRVGYQLGIKRPTAPQRIAQILSGEMGYGEIAQRVIRRLLFQRS